MIIIHKNEFLIVGIKETFQEHELFIKMPKVYEELERSIQKIQFRKNNLIWDISLKREENWYTQLVGVEVENMPVIPHNMIGIKIPKAKYLYYLHKGDVKEIYDAFVLMYDYALKQNLALDKDEFKIEIHDQKNREYYLYLRLRK